MEDRENNIDLADFSTEEDDECLLVASSSNIEDLSDKQTETNKQVFYYDSLEDAIKFKPLNLLPENDPFIRELLILLRKHPSICTSSKKKTNESNQLLNNRNIKEKHSKSLKGDKFNSLSNHGTFDKRSFQSEKIAMPDHENNAVSNKTKVVKQFYLHDLHKGVSVKMEMTEHFKMKCSSLIKELCNIDDSSFVSLFLNCKTEFFELLPQVDHFQEIMPQIVQVFSRISLVYEYQQELISSFLDSSFAIKLISYITILPANYDKDKFSEHEIINLFKNLIKFLEGIYMIIPLKSIGVARKLLVSIQYCIKGLGECQGLELKHICSESASQLLKVFDNKLAINMKEKTNKNFGNDSCEEPPDSITSIDIFPSINDLLEEPNFLRKNIVDGSYRDVKHYIDVQFRLLREDFIAPLRFGIQQYCKSLSTSNCDKNNQFDNIRIHENVRILHGTFSHGSFGQLIELGEGTQNHPKTFMYGSLLIFTSDNFSTFFCATVVNPVDNNLLIVELCDESRISRDDIYGSSFTMIESEVYFEPYYQALKALQDMGRDCFFPMENYIVHVKPKNKDLETLEGQYCPDGLNQSQTKAFKAAIANDFVAIQGPPGTGKTFLALKITKQLLNCGEICSNWINTMSWSDNDSDYDFDNDFDFRMRVDLSYKKTCINKMNNHPYFIDDINDNGYHKPILVICYTNHALDQFLEGLTTVTDRLVRVGGQSKNIVIDEFNLKLLRKNWYRKKRFLCKKCKCYECCLEIKKLNEYFIYLSQVKSILYSYLINLKSLEQSSSYGLLKMQELWQWIHPKLRTVLSKHQFESWLLEGAYTTDIPDDYGRKGKPVNIQTHQLISELRQSSAFRNNLDSDDEEDHESMANVIVNAMFSVKICDLDRKSFNLQRKIRALQKNGANEDIIDDFKGQLDNFKRQSRYVSYMLALKTPINPKKIWKLNNTKNVWSLRHEDRWMLYKWWVHQFTGNIKYNMETLENELAEKKHMVTVKQDEVDLKIMKSAKIIGMTTTSATRLRNILKEIGPKVVIVEEAAEVLEAHIVASLNPEVQKVILIGDHKQLRPSPAVYKLATQYKLEVSLFERMINNGLGCLTLNTQHRMRPEIASLIVPAIYPDLENSPNVYNRPDINGVASNVFFVTHNHPEDEVPESSSRRNAHEVAFLCSLCQYLLQQGYDAEDITILATYAGQMTEMERERKRRNFPTKLRITTVDNYQGEENEIILLSLVRSNSQARIGFLATENRVCVALSRAKNGLFIIGNMDNMTESSTIWRKIKAQLESMNAVGPTLSLGCKNHPDSRTTVCNGNDFNEIPNSGCNIKCGAVLACGHVCDYFCHFFDPDHEGKFSCRRPCERMTCENHRCTKICSKECGKCSVLVVKALPCGHEKNVKCSVDPVKEKCMEVLNVVLSICKHMTTKYCHEAIEPTCLVPCEAILKCGHLCGKQCHRTSHDHVLCFVPVERILRCGHTRTISCYLQYSDVACEEPCVKMLLCGHTCSNRCGENCGQCDTKVEKTLPCGHELVMKCGVIPGRGDCREPCENQLPCGHNCTSICSVDCATITCEQFVQYEMEPACGHDLITVPCHLYKQNVAGNSDLLLQYCVSPCRSKLPCGHTCVGRCGDCFQGRLHIPCTQKCTRTLPCQHRCEEDCKNECPPLCFKPCLFGCEHQDCSEPCGEPCSPCNKRCERRCRHQACSRLCSELCDCSPCDLACPKILSCGHPCSGYCGETCPRDCSICNPGAFSASGDVFKSYSRYVVLEDCGHPVESQRLKMLISEMQSVGQIPNCPVCSTLITRNKRYQEFIKEHISKITLLKEKKKIEMNDTEKKLNTKAYLLKKLDSSRLEKYGDVAFVIWDRLKKRPYTYKSWLWVYNSFDTLRSIGDRFKLKMTRDEQECTLVIERCKILMRGLSRRLNSMSISDYNEILTEIYRLELAIESWPSHRYLLLSLKKYSINELKALK